MMKINKTLKIFLISIFFSIFAVPNASYSLVSYDGSTVVQVADKPMKAQASKDCEAVASIQRKWQGCIFCTLYAPLFNAAQSVALNSSKTFGGPFGNLLAIGMALFIAYETLKLVSSFTQQDIRKYLNTVTIQFFKMMIAFFLLKNMSDFYRLIVNPLLLAGFDFGNAVANLSAEGVVAINTSNLDKGSGGATFGDEIYYAVQNFAIACQSKIAQVISFGRFLMCFSKEAGWKGILPEPTFLFNGAILFCLGLIIMLSFGFLLIDAMIQMGIFGALAPFCLAAWPFKITKNYTSAGWKIFSGIFLTYAMAGVTLKIVFALVGAAIAPGSGGISELASLADTSSDKVLTEKLNSGFSSVFIALACAIIGFRLTGKISELVGKFGGDAGTGIGSDMGKQAMTAGKRLGQSALGAVGKGAKAAADASGLTEKVQQARAKVGAGIKNIAHAPSKMAKAFLGSKTAKAIGGQLKDTFVDTPKENLRDMKEALKSTKAGKAVGNIANKIADSKVGKALGNAAEKTGEFLSDPKEGLKKLDEKMARGIEVHGDEHKEGMDRLQRVKNSQKDSGGSGDKA